MTDSNKIIKLNSNLVESNSSFELIRAAINTLAISFQKEINQEQFKMYSKLLSNCNSAIINRIIRSTIENNKRFPSLKELEETKKDIEKKYYAFKTVELFNKGYITIGEMSVFNFYLHSSRMPAVLFEKVESLLKKGDLPNVSKEIPIEEVKRVFLEIQGGKYETK